MTRVSTHGDQTQECAFPRLWKSFGNPSEITRLANNLDNIHNEPFRSELAHTPTYLRSWQ